MSERTIGNITFDDIENLERFLANKSGIRNIDLDDVIDFIENEVPNSILTRVFQAAKSEKPLMSGSTPDFSTKGNAHYSYPA